MKPFFSYPLFSLVFIFVLIAAGSCRKEEVPPLSEPETTQEIQAEVDPGEVPTALEKNYEALGEQDLTPKIPVGANESLLKVLNVNLDLDRQEEQILVLREKDSVNSYIRLAVLDYDNVIKDYRRTWEGKTESTSIRGFNITLSDLVGDHNLEIICQGISLEGMQSLTVFRKIKGENGTGLNYSEIFNHQANGAIEILEVSRTKAYESGMRDGESFPIITTVQDPESENMMDLIKNTYYWDFSSRHYIKVLETKLPGRQLEEEQLRVIFRSGDDIFIDHINGPWMKNDGSQVIIEINKKTQRITFYSLEIQEVYIWTSSYRLLNNVLLLNGQNELINHVENVITVKLIDLNNLLITVRDIDTQTRIKTPNDFWTGQFFKLSKDVRQNLGSVPVSNEIPKLYGKYTGDTGEEFVFSGTSFVFTSPEESYRGGFSLYFADEDIFSLRLFDQNGIPLDSQTYRYEFEERKQNNTIQRILTLYEGSLLVYGFEPFDKPKQRYQQIEIIEEDQDITDDVPVVQ